MKKKTSQSHCPPQHREEWFISEDMSWVSCEHISTEQQCWVFITDEPETSPHPKVLTFSGSRHLLSQSGDDSAGSIVLIESMRQF